MLTMCKALLTQIDFVVAMLAEQREISYEPAPEFTSEQGYFPVNHYHGVQRRMISVNNFFVFFRLLFFALLLLYVT